LMANKHGHIACTQGGECLAGLVRSVELGLIGADETAVLNATAHTLKFIGFQDMYFNNTFPPEYEITPKPELTNHPHLVIAPEQKERLSPKEFTAKAAQAVVHRLGLKPRG
ncbi:MAG: threonine synthase, partial [Thermodesulfobacteriota bacterium]|nr:threonine synthase [Thermodesulfobacteriota bacterium]